MWLEYQINVLILFWDLYRAAPTTMFKEVGLCLIRRHLQDLDPQEILNESQIVSAWN